MDNADLMLSYKLGLKDIKVLIVDATIEEVMDALKIKQVIEQ